MESFASQTNEKTLQRWLDHELEVMVNVHEVRFEYEKQTQVYVFCLNWYMHKSAPMNWFTVHLMMVLPSPDVLHLQRSCLC